MKTTFKFIIAAMAAIAVFASCQKELVGEISNNTDEGIRVISVQFDNSTKAGLDADGLTPSFEDGDLIRVSNSIKSEVCTLSVSGSMVSFSTNLSDALTAIYPADAAVLSTDEDDAPIATSDNIKVSASQDGDIAKAIIASASIPADQNTGKFIIFNALFQITPPAGVTNFTIKSLKPVVSGVRTGDAEKINNTGTSDSDKCVINVNNNDLDTFYVALLPGVKLTDLSFDAGETFGMKGIPESKIIEAIGNLTAASKKYTIDNQNWHLYVEIGGKKWSAMNLGATTVNSAPNCRGDYYQWGSKSRLYTEINWNGDNASFTWAEGKSNGFVAANREYTANSNLTLY